MKKEENKGLTKKRVIIGISLLAIVIISAIVIFITSNPEKKVENKPEENKIDTPIKETNNNELILKEELSFEINSEVLISDLLDTTNTIKIKNGDEKIDTSKLGEQEVIIKYLLNEEEQEKSVTINIIDTTAPVIESKSELTTTVNKKIDLLKDIKVTDNSKEEIKATVEGEYDFKKEGTYKLKYVAIDSSDNKVEKEFTLKVNKANNNNTSNNKPNNQTTNKPSTNTNTNPNPNTPVVNPDEPNEDDTQEPIDYENSVVALSFGEITIDSAVIHFDGDGSIGATGFELYVYSEDGKLLNTYDIKRPNSSDKYQETSYKLTNLGFRTTYYLHAKSYMMENGNKKYLCQTEGFGDYKRGRNFFTKHDDKIYENELFKYINSKNNNRFTRDSKLDKAAKTCASIYREQILSTGKSTVTAEECLAKNGIQNIKTATFVHVAYPGKACVVGTTSCTGTIFSYVELNENKNKLLYTWEPYKHVGVAYYENVAAVIYMAYTGE